MTIEKCDCLNDCGDDPSVDSFTESCPGFHERKAWALKWLATHLPCWDPEATHVMSATWHATGFLFFREGPGASTGQRTGFVFTLEEINRERERLNKPAFPAAAKKKAEQIDDLRNSFTLKAAGADASRTATSNVDERNYWLGVRGAYLDAAGEVELFTAGQSVHE